MRFFLHPGNSAPIWIIAFLIMAIPAQAQTVKEWQLDQRPHAGVAPNTEDLSRIRVQKATTKLDPRLQQLITERSLKRARISRRVPTEVTPPAPKAEHIRVLFEMHSISDDDIQHISSMGGVF